MDWFNELVEQTTIEKPKVIKTIYIYRVDYYNDMWNIERFPVIYMNDSITYFKTGRKKALAHTNTREVKRDFNISDLAFGQGYISYYYWNVAKDDIKMIKDKNFSISYARAIAQFNKILENFENEEDKKKFLNDLRGQIV